MRRPQKEDQSRPILYDLFVRLLVKGKEVDLTLPIYIFGSH